MSQTLEDRYGFKIVTIGELVASKSEGILENKSIAMCHGVFDIVHPGHVRHLAYAREKADVLVVSVTSDKHITKGQYRPHVPARLRALNLAAFDAVDFVVIDTNPNCLENLEVLKPDIFAKGFEYSEPLPKATQQERAVIESYGGRMLFTPGDVVYSSSQLLRFDAPELCLEKMELALAEVGSTVDDLYKALACSRSPEFHVVGDAIVDSYSRTTLIGGQTKTPTFSVKLDSRDDYVGGAGVVCKHLKAAGANVRFTTLLGEDSLGSMVLADLAAQGINVDPVVDPMRPTTNKNAFIADGYRLLKVDVVDNRPIVGAVLEGFCDSIRSSSAEAVIFSDFRHGIFAKNSVSDLVGSIPEGAVKIADSQVASRWGNITDFKGFDLVTPNEREARFSLADQDSSVGVLAEKIRTACDAKFVALKLGSRGMIGLGAQSYFSLDSFCDAPVDPVGAGDAFLAHCSASLTRGYSFEIASIIGSLAAACACQFDGNKAVTRDQIQEALDSIVSGNR